MTDTPKKTFGKYEAISHLGSGAMGVVWRAQDPILGRTVAIKTISATMGVDNDSKERFLREARAAAQLNHPNIITVYDFGQAGDELYMAMELLEGKDLKELITAGNLTLDQKLNIMEQVSDGMAYAHGRDVVHRDLKPGNIHVQPSGQVKILDFGLARLGSSELTKTGVVMGTPNYMSPEQVMGERADSRSDVFSAGAVFYELLTNRKPFDADSVHATLYQVVHREPPPPRQWDATLPEGLVSIIEIAMTKQMTGRQKDGRALHDAIRGFRYGEEPEVVEEYDDPADAAASPAAPDPISSDATSFSPGSSAASSASVSRSAPAPFRSYGRSGSAGANSTNVGAGLSSIGRAPRTDSKPPSAQSGPVDSQAPSASALTPPPKAPTKNLMPMIGAGVGALVLAGLIGAFVMNRKPEEKAPSNLDALAANLVENQLGLARRALSDKDYKGALEQADRVIKLEPANPEAMGIKEQAQSAISEIETWVGVARAAVARGASAQATAALERVMARDPRNPVVAELSGQLNASFSARASDARTEMEKARDQAEGQDGAAGEAAFAEGEELAAAATQSFDAGEFTTATQTFIQARDAYDRARRAVTSGSRPAGGASAPRVPIASAPAPTTETGPAVASVPSSGTGAGSLPAAPQALPAVAAGSSAGDAREFQTSPTSVDGATPAEFEGRVEFEVQPTPLRVGTPFRVRIFFRNEGKKDSKLDRLSVKIARNGEPSSPEAKIVKDDVKMGQRTLVATIPAQDSGKSLFLPPGTTAWSLDVEGTSRKGERIRSTLTMKQH